MNWWFTEGRKPKRCMHMVYKQHPDFPNTHETRSRNCLFDDGHDGPHLFQYPCDRSELCVASPHEPDCPVVLRKNKEFASSGGGFIERTSGCTKEWGCKADFHDPECLTYLEEQEKREVHNTSGGLTERCAWRDYLKGGRNRCVLRAGHDDHHKLKLCRGDCGDIDCPDCNDADRDLLDSPIYPVGGLVDEPDEGLVTAEGFATKPGKLRTRINVSHYTTGEIETIDYIYDKLGLDGGRAYVLGNILKYASRAKHKGQFDSDIEKIRNYAVIMQEQERKRS